MHINVVALMKTLMVAFTEIHRARSLVQDYTIIHSRWSKCSEFGTYYDDCITEVVGVQDTYQMSAIADQAKHAMN